MASARRRAVVLVQGEVRTVSDRLEVMHMEGTGATAAEEAGDGASSIVAGEDPFAQLAPAG